MVLSKVEVTILQRRNKFMLPSIAMDEECFFTPDFERVHWMGVIVFVTCFLIPWSTAYKEIKHILHPLDIKRLQGSKQEKIGKANKKWIKINMRLHM
jgi:hypothetical protein